MTAEREWGRPFVIRVYKNKQQHKFKCCRMRLQTNACHVRVNADF